MVNRDLERILEFCQSFQSECLKPLKSKADELNGLSGKITSALSGSDYATDKSKAVKDTAIKILSAVEQGEQRIREIEQRVQEQIVKRKQLESEGR